MGVCKKGLIQSKQTLRGAEVGLFCLREPNQGVLGSKASWLQFALQISLSLAPGDRQPSLCVSSSPLVGLSEISPPTQETLVICLLPETR